MLVSRWRCLCVLFVVLPSAFLYASSPEPPASTPIELRHGVPFVRVLVNGRGPFTFCVDTGTSNDAIVTPALAATLKLPVVARRNLSDVSGQNVQQVNEVAVDSISLAGVEFHSLRAVVHQPLASEGSYDGILGFQLFRNLQLTLDYPRRTLELSTAELTDPHSPGVRPLLLYHNVPMVNITVGDMQVQAQIDSGGMGLCLPATVAHELKFSGAVETVARGNSQVGAFLLQGGTIKGRIELADQVFNAPFVEISESFPVANIGALPLQGLAVTFDQRNKLVRFQASSRKQRATQAPMLALAQTPVSSRGY
jgi:predicted aspartyl protease